MKDHVLLGTGRLLRFGPPAGVMGILNVTPDSFSDGGVNLDPATAIAAGLAMAAAGAALLDLGGESTRPRGSAYGAGACEVSEEEELARVLPVLAGLRRGDTAIPVSIDTRRTAVVRAALEAGADVVNLVTGLDASPDLLAAVATHGGGLILSHCRGTPSTTFELSRFADVVGDVSSDLAVARDRALAAGIPADRLLLDPGLGFGKSAEQNFALLAGLDRLAPPGVPIVVGASRKAFLGSLSARPPRERLPESLAAAAAAVGRLAGRNPLLLRVHDVLETLRFLAVLART